MTPWGFPIPWLPKNCQSQSRAHSGSPSCAPDDQMKYFNKVKKDKSPLYPTDETKFSSILFFNRKKSSIYLYPIAAKVVEDDFESNLVLIWCHRHFSANIQNKYFKLVLVCRDISLKSSKMDYEDRNFPSYKRNNALNTFTFSWKPFQNFTLSRANKTSWGSCGFSWALATEVLFWL